MYVDLYAERDEMCSNGEFTRLIVGLKTIGAFQDEGKDVFIPVESDDSNFRAQMFYWLPA